MLGARYAEAYEHGQVGVLAYALDELAHALPQLCARARYARYADAVDEASRVGADELDAPASAGRRQQGYEVQATLRAPLPHVQRLLGREIGHDDAVGSGFSGVGGESGESVAQVRVVVPHQHDRRLQALPPEAAHRLQADREVDAVLEGPVARLLDGGPLGQRVAERDAQLD